MKFTKLTLRNFRIHKEFALMLTARTVIRGKNEEGKSSLCEAMVWCLYGTDVFGISKQDHEIKRTDAKDMEVTLTGIADNGQTITVTRSRDKSQVLLFNGVRKGAQENIEKIFGTLPEFLTMFTPGYFSQLEPKEARTVLARCLPTINREDVIARLNPDHQSALSVKRFPMIGGVESMDFLLEKTRREIRDLETELTRLDGEIRGIDGIMNEADPVEPVRKITPERRIEHHKMQKIAEEETVRFASRDANLAALRSQLVNLRTAYDSCKAQWQQKMDVNCVSCGQRLPLEKVESIRVKAEANNAKLRKQMDEHIAKGNRVKQERMALEGVDVSKPDAMTQARLAQFQLDEEADRRAATEYAVKRAMLDRAKARSGDARQTRASEEKRIVELRLRIQALDEYRFEYTRMQNERLNANFTHVRIDLVDANRETGEIRSVFRIHHKGRWYRALSKSAKIRCDIEIGRVIALARGEKMPVFIDNSESVQDLFGEAFSGQVIAAYVDQGLLKVETLDGEQAVSA